MTNTDQLARECAEKIVMLTGFGHALHVNDIAPDIAATFRPVVEERDRLREDHAAINAERAEARAIRDEMIRAQDENTQLRAALDQAEGAGKNLAAELCQWCPHEVRGPVLTQWDQALARIADIKNGGAHD